MVSAVTSMNTLMLSVLDSRGGIDILHEKEQYALSISRSSWPASAYLASIALPNVLSIDVAYRASTAAIAIGLGALLTCLPGSIPPAVRAARLKYCRGSQRRLIDTRGATQDFVPD
jgi:hypothetical protein